MQIEVTLLGGFAVAVDGVPIPASAWRSRRAAQLVALLSLSPQRRLTTEQAIDALWPDLAPDAARANLHKTATLARQTLGAKDSVVLRNELVSLGPGTEVTVDAVDVEREARAAVASGDADACAAVARRWGGAELLPEERYEDWAAPSRDRLAALYLDVLRTGRLWAALAEAEATDEAAHRALMHEHVEAGRLHAAIRQFQRLRTILAREVGVLPSPRRWRSTGRSWARPRRAGSGPGWSAERSSWSGPEPPCGGPARAGPRRCS